MISELGELCRRVSAFARRRNWQFTARPIISFEFATIMEFSRARADLLAAINNDPMLTTTVRRDAPSSEVEEFQIAGVTFRLTCKQLMMTPRGVYGASEIK